MALLRLRTDELKWREIEDEMVAVDVRNSTYLSANASATILWRRLVSGATRDDLAAELVDRFGIGVEQARSDVDAFVGDLGAQGLLEE